MTSVWCVRAEYGMYAPQFVAGGYVAIGWMPDCDLTMVASKDQLYPLYRAAHPDDKSNIVIGQQVGQIFRFLVDIKPGDYVITPAADTEWLHYGTVDRDPSYMYAPGDDGCPYRHRRRVIWTTDRLSRSSLSVPFQTNMRSLLTVFGVSHVEEFLEQIGKASPGATSKKEVYDAYRVVIEQVLELDDKEFEILVGHLLTALGFEGSEVTGKPGDGGVDVTGELNVANLAKVRVFVQAKRYKANTTISASTVRELRQAIPKDGQGAFITTADFQKKAHEVALDPNFPRIGLVNGRQLVDLLVEYWDKIPEEFRIRLGLQPGLVRM